MGGRRERRKREKREGEEGSGAERGERRARRRRGRREREEREERQSGCERLGEYEGERERNCKTTTGRGLVLVCAGRRESESEKCVRTCTCKHR